MGKRPQPKIMQNSILVLVTLSLLSWAVFFLMSNHNKASFKTSEVNEPMLFEPNLWGDLYPNCDVFANIKERREGHSGYNLTYSYHIDNHGFKGENQIIQSGTCKILLLGDGYAFGIGLDGDQDVTSQLASILRWDYPNISLAIFNGGMPGYTITDEFDYICDKGRAISPHLVIVIVSPDDIWEIERPIVVRRKRKNNAIYWNKKDFFSFIKNNLIFELKKGKYSRLLNRRKYSLFRFREFYLHKTGLSEEYALNKLVPKYKEIAINFKNEVAKNKGRTLFVLFQSPKSLENTFKDSGLDYIYIGIPRYIREPLLPDGHWSADMCRFVANQIKDWIIEKQAITY